MLDLDLSPSNGAHCGYFCKDTRICVYECVHAHTMKYMLKTRADNLSLIECGKCKKITVLIFTYCLKNATIIAQDVTHYLCLHVYRSTIKKQPSVTDCTEVFTEGI